MIKTITAGVLATGLMMSGAAADLGPTDLGEYRVTTYCQYCNEEVGFQSASGQRLDYGQVAMNGVPFGTKISIDGEIFTVVDRCGIDGTVDIFIENDSNHCQCNTLDYRKVFIVD